MLPLSSKTGFKARYFHWNALQMASSSEYVATAILQWRPCIWQTPLPKVNLYNIIINLVLQYTLYQCTGNTINNNSYGNIDNK